MSFLFQESKSSEAEEEEVTETKDEEAPESPKADEGPEPSRVEEDLATGVEKELEKLSVKPTGDE